MPRDRRRSLILRIVFTLTAALPLLGSLLLATGCATVRPAADPETLWKEYEQAVAAAKYPTPQHVSRNLVPITTFTPGLVWDEKHEKVLMGTWTKAKYYPGTPPYETPLGAQTWLTAVPFLQQFCRKTGLQGDALRLRIAQRLGIPPDSTNDVIVQMWIDPHTFFRPCPDPEINDAECQVNLTAGPVDTAAPCPWAAALIDQLSGKFVTVAQSQLEWTCSNWTSSYPPGEPRKSYPWTALGYTYDWGGKDFYGESEFVAFKDTPVVIESITTTDAYCAPVPAGRR